MAGTLTALFIRWLARVWVGCASLVALALTASPVLPDGGEVVFAGYRYREEWGIYRVDVDHGLMFRLSSARIGCCMQWPPGSTEIRLINYAGRLVFIDADGRGERLVERERLLYTMSDWSPDGRHVVIPARNAPGDLQIFNTSGEIAQSFPNLGQAVIFPRWSPDASRILYTVNGSGIYTLDLNAGESRRLTTRLSVKPADWSPDGEQIAFVAGTNGQAKIYLMHTDGSQLRPLVPTPTTQEFEPVWSPDGQQIAFMSNASRRFNLYTITCNPTCAGEAHQLTDKGLTQWTYTWSPDSSTIAVIAQVGPGVGIFTIDVQAGTPKPVIAGFNLIKSLIWRP